MPAPELANANAIHLCVDMQGMFAEVTDWHAAWLKGVLPAVEELAGTHAERTIFTRFIPPGKPEDAPGAWKDYYRRWESMTRENLKPELIELVPSLARLVPPARVFDKPVYSPWFNGQLHSFLRGAGVDTVIVTGGETDVCVLAAVLGAIDLGYKVVLPADAVFGSADQTHDAMLGIFNSRFGQQLTVCQTQDILDSWRP